EMLGPETYDPQAEKDTLMKAVRQNIPPTGILVSPADPELMREAIDSAVAAGIPVVTIDSDSPKSKRLLFVGTNNYDAGQMGGDILVKELNGKGTVVVYSILGQENLNERLEGYKRAIRPPTRNQNSPDDRHSRRNRQGLRRHPWSPRQEDCPRCHRLT